MVEVDRFLRAVVNKQIHVGFAGKHLPLSLSQGLFSSHALDGGTASLLRLIERNVDLSRITSVLDLGCGTGALGLPVAAATGARLYATDRDALATWLTKHNAIHMGHDDIEVDCSLDAQQLPDRQFSIAVSNLPAKAGERVLDNLVRGLTKAIGTAGIGAAVIVRPLEPLLNDLLARADASITDRKSSANHAAVLWTGSCERRAAETEIPAGGFAAYVRATATFDGPKGPYVAATVFGLSDFDNLSYRISLCFGFMRRLQFEGKVVVYGVGQGHLAMGCRQCGAADLAIAGRDALAIAASARNLGSNLQTMLVPTLSAITNHLASHSVDWLVVNDDPIPGSLWSTEIETVADHLLVPGGKLLVLSRTTATVRLEHALGGSFRLLDDRKQKGFRICLWKCTH